ncbi:MAG TPA: DUF5335 family protein [Roseiflexaceae bacterium]|nr:DUF5335 family protein [Roseiflexaceae bacterium]
MAMQDAQRETWVALLDDFTRQFAGRSARLEVVGQSGKQNVVADNVPFDGISADLHDGEDNVSIILLPPGGAALNHVVDNVQRVNVDSLNGQAARVEIQASNGTTTVLSLH